MRTQLFTLVAGLGLLAAAGPVTAQQPAAGERGVVSVILQRSPLRDAVAEVMRGSGLQYVVDPVVPNVPISLTASAPRETVLRELVRSAAAVVPGLTVSRDGDVYRVALRRPGAPEDDLAALRGFGGGERSVTVHLVEVPLREAIEKVVAGSGLEFRVQPDVPNVPITLDLRQVPLESALRLMVRQAGSLISGLAVSRLGDLFLIGIGIGKPEAPAPFPPVEVAAPAEQLERKVTLDLRDIPLRDAIAIAFRGSGLQYSIDPNVPDVPIALHIRDVPLEAAVRLIIRQAAIRSPGISARARGQITVIERRDAPPPQKAEGGPEAAERKVTLDLQETPLRDAIALAFRGSGLQYAVAPDVPNVAITLNVRELPVQAVTRLIVRQAASLVPGLTSRMDGRITFIEVRAAAPPPQEAPAEASELMWEKIPLQFADVVGITHTLGGALLADPPERALRAPVEALVPAEVDLAGQGGTGGLVPPGITGILGIRRDNSLMVRGTPEDIHALKNILRLVDIPPRQIRVRLSTGRLSAEGQVINSAALQLTDVAGTEKLSATVRPRVNGDGTVSVVVEGTLTAGGVSRPLRSHVRIASGRTLQLVNQGEGDRAARLWLRAEVLPEHEALGGR